MDAEEATQLKLRKNQEYKTYIFVEHAAGEQLFSQALPLLEAPLRDVRQKDFIERRAPDSETLIDLYYGYPVYVDERDMLCPLFFTAVTARIPEPQTLHISPKKDSLSVNRMHFIKHYSAEEVQDICAELEGNFGSFDARLKAAAAYIPALQDEKVRWLTNPVLFRSNLSGMSANVRYDLTCLLKDQDVLTADTALAHFLRGGEGVHVEKRSAAAAVLEVGALNPQQEDAVAKGLRAPLSVITGPPGTGKTQVVTALLASAVFHGQTVLFSSNNNMPVNGVYDRLGRSMQTAGNWVLRMGNQEYRESCYNNISALLNSLQGPDQPTPDFLHERDRFAAIEREIAQVRTELSKAQRLERDIGNLYEKELLIKSQLPEDWAARLVAEDPQSLESKGVEAYRRHSAAGLWLWLRRRFLGTAAFRQRHNDLLNRLAAGNEDLDGWESRLLVDEEWDVAVSKARETARLIALYQGFVLCLSQRRRLEEMQSHLPSQTDLAGLKDRKVEISQALLDKAWLKDIVGTAGMVKEALNVFFKDIEDFSPGRHKRLAESLNKLKRYFPIWITTNQSAGAIMPPQSALFDMVVIDEAGQCSIPSILPLLHRAKRAVLIGDPHQFRHISSLKDNLDYDIALAAAVDDIAGDWSYTHRSAFDRGLAATRTASFLSQHYRCHPDIIEFSNRSFYDGKLIVQARPSRGGQPLPVTESGLVWHNVTGHIVRAQKGAWNPAEIDKTIEVLGSWAGKGLFAMPGITFGIVTPFRRQAEEMRKVLWTLPWFEALAARFTIGTAHSFQGSECDILIYSPVVGDGMDEYLVKFAAAQKDLINVTVTRAKHLLYIVGDFMACQAAPADSPLHQLAAYAESLRRQHTQPMNAAEKAMADMLDSLGLSHIPQYRLDPYRLDFMVNAPSGARYDVEVDGDIHLGAEAVQHDERRDAYVNQQGFAILRFTARDVLFRPEAVRARLLRI